MCGIFGITVGITVGMMVTGAAVMRMRKKKKG
jgi:hypothetical protein